MKIIKLPVLLAILFALGTETWYGLTRVRVSHIQREQPDAGDIPLGHMLLPGRQTGYISLDKFIGLIRGIDEMQDSTQIRIYPGRDSVSFRVSGKAANDEFRNRFYNGNVPGKWEDLYQNMPVRLLRGPLDGFVAKIDTIGGKACIRLPYEMLYSAIRSSWKTKIKAGDKTAIVSPAAVHSGQMAPDQITIKKEDADSLAGAKGRQLIQTEGIVWQHVASLISQSSYKNASEVTRLCYLWQNAYTKWVYINDPVLANHGDRWRSASETIGTWYFDDAHHYSGDCDDFAILVASFARQIGLPSRFVGAFGLRGGHAYSEFFVPDDQLDAAAHDIKQYFHYEGEINCTPGEKGKWINMDWWATHIGGRYFPGVQKIYPL